MAGGEYIWLCGQDDRIFPDGLEMVIEFLGQTNHVDFVYLNNHKISESTQRLDYTQIRPSYGIKHRYGLGLNEFLSHHAYQLPTFLPKFILRRVLWESVDASKYFGTSYCQVGVFLEVSKNLHWCHFDGNFVVGLTPENGWQSNGVKFTKISLGMYAMLYLASQEASWLDGKVLRKLVKKYYKRLILSCLLIKSHNITVGEVTINQILKVTKRSFPLYCLIIMILRMPRWFSFSLLKVLKGRRVYRSKIFGINPEGPKIE
jgi:hypothetical protein